VQYILAAASEQPQSANASPLIFIVILLIFAIIVKFGRIFTLWLQAHIANADISFTQILGMRLRKVDAQLIIKAMIDARQNGLTEITLEMLEAHYLAGGHVPEVVRALIAAKLANVPLEFTMIAALDIAGRDVLAIAQKLVDKNCINHEQVTDELNQNLKTGD